MHVGKTLFAQVMTFVPWKTFGRIITRHQGDAGVRTLGCADVFRVMAFAQLTWRESLRDIGEFQDKLTYDALRRDVGGTDAISRSGLSRTVVTGDQSLVGPLQRAGARSRACV